MSDKYQQTILAVDEKGEFTEYIPRMVGHTGEGKRHLAITVLIYNDKGEVLLQKRKHKVFDDIWDITGATHPIHKEDGVDESLEESTLRCLKTEWGIESVNLKDYGAFPYFAKYDEYCENEYCYILVGEYSGEIRLNPDEGYSHKWMGKGDFLEDIDKSPQNYTPWAVEAVKLLKAKGFFS